MRTSNPALNDQVFTGLPASEESMTLNGTVNKTAILLALALATSMITWSMVGQPALGAAGEIYMNPLVMPLMIGGAIGSFIFAMIGIFRKTAVTWAAPAYALLEGLFLGGISAFFELQYPGIVIQAVGLTFGTLFALLMAYRSNLIRATENFKLGVVSATGAICILYLVNLVMHLFGSEGIGFIHESGPIGIGFSLFVVTIAALNLVLDFDFIENGVEAGAPKYMEWYGALGLMITLVWLYIEFLRLLAKLRD